MKTYRYLTILCGAAFILLCLLHYFSQRPLWLDENFILNNIKDFSFRRLLGPLKDSQAFARAYLILIKLFSQRFNYSVLALRFFPLVSMICAFFAWAKVYAKESCCRRDFLFALFAFPASYYLSYYAAELKHYSMDVFVMGTFCLYLLYQRQYFDSGKEPSKVFTVATFLLPFALLFSYSGFFAFWVVAWNFLLGPRRNPKYLLLAIGYSFICLLCVAFVFCFDLRHTLSVSALFSYWQDYFVSIDSFSGFFKTFGEGSRKLVVWWFADSSFFRRAASVFIPVFMISLFSYGAKAIKKDKFKVLSIDALALVIFLGLFSAGIMKKYPFTGGRITLFFAPFVFYMVVKGISSLRRFKPLYLVLSIFYVSFLLLSFLNSLLSHLKLYV